VRSGLAVAAFDRNGYTATCNDADTAALRVSASLESPWDLAVHDPGLAEQWPAWGKFPAATLGRGVWDLYRARDACSPGCWGRRRRCWPSTTGYMCWPTTARRSSPELEVFAFIARANDDMWAFPLLAMVVSLFETGYLRTGAGCSSRVPGTCPPGPGCSP
jgi:hypothetical protein